jgi:ketol-acid reductoisomerase
VIRDIETLQNKKDMITNLLADALQKKEYAKELTKEIRKNSSFFV